MADILIIGGGVSGLSTGIYAQKYGHHATICEKLPTAGGNLTGWKRGDYYIDNCIHWLTGTNPSSPFYQLWEELGALGDDVPVYRPKSLYTCEYGGQTLSLWRDWSRVEREMLELSPADKREIKRLSRSVRALQHLSEIGGPRKNRGFSPIPVFAGSPSLLRDLRLSTGELANRFAHPLIRTFLTSFLSDRISSMVLLFVFAHFCGGNADLPLGGSVPMAKRLLRRFRELGGEFLPGKEAVRILHENGRATEVLFADGSTASADEIVVTIDPAVAFPRLLNLPMPKNQVARYRDPRLFRFSACHCAFACDLPAAPFSGDFVWELPAPIAFRLGSPGILLREFSHDPSAAPAGKTLLQVMMPCTEAAARRWIEQRGDLAAYRAHKAGYAATVLAAVEEKFPSLRGHLFCLDVWTPATYRRFIGSEMGSFMSFLFRAGTLPRRADYRVPSLENLTFAGQWQYAPGGLPVAAICGRDTAASIAKKYRRATAPRRVRTPLRQPLT